MAVHMHSEMAVHLPRGNTAFSFALDQDVQRAGMGNGPRPAPQKLISHLCIKQNIYVYMEVCPIEKDRKMWEALIHVLWTAWADNSWETSIEFIQPLCREEDWINS